MRVILSIVFLALTVILAGANMYEGQYILTGVYDKNKASIALPPGHEFRLQVSAVSEASHSRQEVSYDFTIQIGNSMRAIMMVTSSRQETDSVRFGPIMSTRMMPPHELAELENAFSKALPETSSIALDGEVLKLEGANGGMTFRVG